MSENPLFRKAALDKLASPERLDVLMRVTSPMGWLALTTVGGILIGVIVWSILGSIPERIDGQGVLLRGGGKNEIRATGSGTITIAQPQGQRHRQDRHSRSARTPRRKTPTKELEEQRQDLRITAPGIRQHGQHRARQHRPAARTKSTIQSETST